MALAFVSFSRNRLIRDEPFANRLLVAAGALGLPGAVAFFQSGVERVEGRPMRHWSEEVRPGILYQGFDLAFVVVVPRAAKPLVK